MAFKKFGNKGKKSDFVRVGNMFKSDKQYLPQGAAFSYSTTCSGEYLDKVAEAIVKIAESGGGARFTLTKWEDKEHPALSVSPAKAKGDAKRIKKDGQDSFHAGEGDQGGL